MRLTTISIAASLLSLLFVLNPLYASDLKWKDLKGLEKFLLSEHKSDWKDYGDSKKTILHNSVKKKAKKLQKYKKWVKKHLSSKQQKVLKDNFKKMSDKQFKKYMDGLFKRYGRPV
ncbi:MAG: Unknown protein [uncultured Thiotrichaceae bacterium]|uniref:DUF3106 domain-containing protein n=1 Tax=uncultured Thiotrichaceae bacterium TaxID=298394 RepID=A0A6S6UHC9_9GAMM|nr:MAG: Unknown protein [uncultured Thiotrichaceae bacterium]